MRRMLIEMKPSRFEDIIVAIALFRPGPMQDIPAYVARKHGREPIEYLHEWRQQAGLSDHSPLLAELDW